MPGARLTSMYGPVPFAFIDAWVSSLFLKSSGLVTLCFSHQALLMIHSGSDMCSMKIGLTACKWNSTVRSSTFVGVPTALA